MSPAPTECHCRGTAPAPARDTHGGIAVASVIMSMHHQHPESWIIPNRVVKRLLRWSPRSAGSRTRFGASAIDAREEPANSGPRAGRKAGGGSEQTSRPGGSKRDIGTAD